MGFRTGRERVENKFFLDYASKSYLMDFQNLKTQVKFFNNNSIDFAA